MFGDIQKTIVFLTSYVAILGSGYAFEVPAAVGKKCEYVHSMSSDSKAAEAVSGLIKRENNGRLFPRSLEKTDGNHIMFGFESEFTALQWGNLLKIYGPRAEFGVSQRDWLSLSDGERVAWVKARAQQLPAGDKDIGLILLEGQTLNGQVLPAFLSKKLILDETGNLEIVQDPVNTLSEFTTQARWITKNLGAGSMQGTVSNLRKSFFAENVSGQFGFFTFIGQLDPLKKLALGGERYLSDQSKDTVKAFNHPFLGPLTRLKQGHLLQYLRFNREGEFFDPERKAFIAAQDDSFKYTGMTAYRPDIGGSQRIGTEVRDAHNDVEMLIERVSRVAYFHHAGTLGFKSFAHIRSFDSYKEFNKLDPKIQDMLRTLFPLRKKPGIEYTKSELLAREVFRNFAMPMQDWGPWLVGLGKTELQSDIKAAQEIYINRLMQIESDFASKVIDQETAARQVQGAIGLFALESQLVHAMDAFIAQQINGRETQN